MTLVKNYEAFVTTSQNNQTSMNSLTEMKINVKN